MHYSTGHWTTPGFQGRCCHVKVKFDTLWDVLSVTGLKPKIEGLELLECVITTYGHYVKNFIMKGLGYHFKLCLKMFLLKKGILGQKLNSEC
jgi:hypothetical protein